jgi:integrase
LFTLALMTGMRQGELLGLRWHDVDLDQGLLHVRQTLKSLPGEPVFGPPKSASSRRFIPLDDLAEAALRTQKERQAWERKQAGIAWQEWGGGLVFTRHDGRPLDPRESTRRLQRLAKDAGLGHITFHQLRHGFTSLMAASGASLAEVRDLLGHSTITLTANTYTHLFPEVKRDAVRRMAALVKTGTRG